jgi:hypothetical protein
MARRCLHSAYSLCEKHVSYALFGSHNLSVSMLSWDLERRLSAALPVSSADWIVAQWLSDPRQEKRVVRRCLHSYSINMLAGDDADGVTYTGIPWVSLGREFPVHVRPDTLALPLLIAGTVLGALWGSGSCEWLLRLH